MMTEEGMVCKREERCKTNRGLPTSSYGKVRPVPKLWTKLLNPFENGFPKIWDAKELNTIHNPTCKYKYYIFKYRIRMKFFNL